MRKNKFKKVDVKQEELIKEKFLEIKDIPLDYQPFFEWFSEKTEQGKNYIGNKAWYNDSTIHMVDSPEELAMVFSPDN